MKPKILIQQSILTSIMTIVTSIGGIAGPMTAAAHAASAAGILYTIIDAPQPQTSGTKEYLEVDSQDIVLENVNFGYPMRPDLRILENLNVTFPAGKVTAIVGASGSGKSTIVGLLERWYELDGYLAPEALVSPKPLMTT
jgi:ATP-binding cassette subfamily B (MDR/TAP) protein 1